MKKLIFILSLLIFLANLVSATNDSCVIDTPYFGSVNCEESGDWSKEISIGDGEKFECPVPNCRINGLSVDDFGCTGFGTTSKVNIKKNGATIIDCHNTIGGSWGDSLSANCESNGLSEKTFNGGEVIEVDFSCNLGNPEPEDNPKLLVSYREIKLKMHYDSGNNFQSGTEMCNINSVWDSYKNKQLSDNSLLKSVSIDNMGTSSDKGLSSVPSEKMIGDLRPSQLHVGEGYWFVYDWVERPSLISSEYKGKDVWCNAIDHSLTQLQEVNTKGNNCYLIPTTKLSEKGECCSSDECKGLYANKAILCTDEFKCGFEKSCLSDYDCGATEQCQAESGKYYLVNSYCDKSELDDYGKGSCKS